MKRILVALLLVTLAAPAWGGAGEQKASKRGEVWCGYGYISIGGQRFRTSKSCGPADSPVEVAEAVERISPHDHSMLSDLVIRGNKATVVMLQHINDMHQETVNVSIFVRGRALCEQVLKRDTSEFERTHDKQRYQ